MRKRLLLVLFAGVSLNCFSQIKSSEELLRVMLLKFSGKFCKTLTFSQNTYRPNDSLNPKMVWYEAIEYPGKLRIDFNSTTKGNAAIFCNDTAYSFRKGILSNRHPDKNEILLILGGWFFRDYDDVVKRLKESDYDLERFSQNNWRKQPVYVIGANKGDTVSNQIWIDQKTLRVVRTLSRLSPGEELDMHVDGRTQTPCGTVESLLSFYINGKLDQREEYKEIKTNVTIDPAVFDPGQFGKVHWKKTESEKTTPVK